MEGDQNRLLTPRKDGDLEGDGCVDAQLVATQFAPKGEKFDSSSLRRWLLRDKTLGSSH